MRIQFLRLLEVLAGSSESALRQQVQYLKAENQILRSRMGRRMRFTPRERARLVKFAIPLGTALSTLATIVRPHTLRRWISESKGISKRKYPPRDPGRPRTPDDVRDLILRIAGETGWGFTRIQGELRKLGVKRVSRSTIINILKEAKMPTAPDRNDSTWYEFLRRHAETLWACDFMAHRVLTPTGWKQAFLLVFIHIASRRAYTSPATFEPGGEWLTEQVEAFAERTKDSEQPVDRRNALRSRRLIHDRDTLFDRKFKDAVKAAGIVPHPIPVCAPNLNAFVERFHQTLQVECLDKFLVMGTRHLDYLVREYLDHYNAERPHSSLGFATPVGRSPEARAGPVIAGTIRCSERLGGVIKHYTRMAA